jgi:hypothetical protein
LLEATAYTVRLEHIAGADLQIDAIGVYPEPGTGLATWGGIKAVYQ